MYLLCICKTLRHNCLSLTRLLSPTYVRLARHLPSRRLLLQSGHCYPASSAPPPVLHRSQWSRTGGGRAARLQQCTQTAEVSCPLAPLAQTLPALEADILLDLSGQPLLLAQLRIEVHLLCS